MLTWRLTAALALVPVAGVCVGAFSGSAAALTPAAGGSGPTPAPPAARTSAAIMRVAAIKHYGQPDNASGFSVIVATGAEQAWAFASTPIAARWNGTALAPSTLPTGLTGFINDASAPAPNDIWAAGQYGGYVLHWNGLGWRVARRWPSGQITGLSATSASDVWVFGTAIDGSRMAGTWHFDGRSWLPVTGPADSIYRASAVSQSDIWAVAANPGGPVILRYNGSTWSRMRTGTALNGIQPADILALSNRDVWVAGDEISRGGLPRLELVHWNGRRWSRLANGTTAWVGRLAPGSDGEVLLTATPASAAATGLIVHASPSGWGSTIVVAGGLGSGVSDVALAPRTSSLWATGGILTRLGGAAAIWSGPMVRTDHPDNV
jgi:hypothetical protein